MKHHKISSLTYASTQYFCFNVGNKVTMTHVFDTYTDVSTSHSIYAIHMFVEFWTMAIPVPVVGRDKEVGMDHLVLEKRSLVTIIKR